MWPKAVASPHKHRAGRKVHMEIKEFVERLQKGESPFDLFRELNQMDAQRIFTEAIYTIMDGADRDSFIETLEDMACY